MKRCPYCAEEIQDEAIKCKHCKEELKTGICGNKNKKESREGAFLQTLNCGCMFVLIIVVIIGVVTIATLLFVK